MITKPTKGMTKGHISQTYHKKHEALDIVAYGKDRGYGTPLCAPEDVEVVKITGDTFTPGDTHNLERGYGIYLKGLETGFTYLYWHTLPVLPVDLGQVVKRGKIIAFMGNAGYVFSGGVYVPLEDRLNDNKPGTHLHLEMYDQTYKIGGKKKFLNPLDYIDWNLEPTYTKLDHLSAILKVYRKTLTLKIKQ